MEASQSTPGQSVLRADEGTEDRINSHQGTRLIGETDWDRQRQRQAPSRLLKDQSKANLEAGKMKQARVCRSVTLLPTRLSMTGTPTLRWYLFGLMMTMTTLETTMANETMTLTGYLCDHPDRVQDYRVLPFNQSACWAPKTEAKPEGMYSIVQKQTYALAEGTKCVKTISRFTFVCTHNLVAAHQRLARVPGAERRMPHVGHHRAVPRP